MVTMARTPNPKGSTPMYAATIPYKIWVRGQVALRGWTQREVAARIKTADRSQAISAVAFAQHFGGDEADLKPSNISFMPALHKALGVQPPTEFEPPAEPSEVEQLQLQLGHRWPDMADETRNAIKALLGHGLSTRK